jgi:hypothetical protein
MLGLRAFGELVGTAKRGRNLVQKTSPELNVTSVSGKTPKTTLTRSSFVL